MTRFANLIVHLNGNSFSFFLPPFFVAERRKSSKGHDSVDCDQFKPGRRRNDSISVQVDQFTSNTITDSIVHLLLSDDSNVIFRPHFASVDQSGLNACSHLLPCIRFACQTRMNLRLSCFTSTTDSINYYHNYYSSFVRICLTLQQIYILSSLRFILFSKIKK